AAGGGSPRRHERRGDPPRNCTCGTWAGWHPVCCSPCWPSGTDCRIALHSRRKSMRLRHVSVSLAVLGFAVAAPALHAQDSRDDKFRAWDTNRDGRLEIGEMQQNQANFRAMDCNHDGYLSYDELTNRYRCDENSSTSVPPPVVDPVRDDDEYARLDRNRDGVLTQGEWVSGVDAFRRYDRNTDGRVTRDEYGNPLDANSVEGRFQSEDLNNDGMITRGEWRGDRVTFDRLDRDHDAVLNYYEYANLAPAD